MKKSDLIFKRNLDIPSNCLEFSTVFIFDEFILIFDRLQFDKFFCCFITKKKYHGRWRLSSKSIQSWRCYGRICWESNHNSYTCFAKFVVCLVPNFLWRKNIFPKVCQIFDLILKNHYLFIIILTMSRWWSPRNRLILGNSYL